MRRRWNTGVNHISIRKYYAFLRKLIEIYMLDVSECDGKNNIWIRNALMFTIWRNMLYPEPPLYYLFFSRRDFSIGVYEKLGTFVVILG
mgnify:CR=1 FL=1